MSVFGVTTGNHTLLFRDRCILVVMARFIFAILCFVIVLCFTCLSLSRGDFCLRIL